MKKIKIIYEDKDIIVVDKPAKLLTINTNDGNQDNLYTQVRDYIKKKNPRHKIFIVHRLDRETSGLVLFAKSEDNKQYLQENWNTFTRRYVAIVEGQVKKDKDTINSYIAETKTLQVYCTSDKTYGKLATTNYEVISKNKHLSILNIDILTGRKNQIRVQLSSIGHPIVGDKKYNSKINPLNRMALHANYLRIIHPQTKESIEFSSSLPSSFKKLTI